MSTLKKYNLMGQEVGSLTLSSRWTEDAVVPSQMIKDYIVALRANDRQWSANTKGRSEVNHSCQKPHKQKGLGRSRQGRLSSPQYKGGGRVFGPKPKFDQHIKVNKKERRLAVFFLLKEKLQSNRIRIVDNFAMEAPKTKSVIHFLKTTEVQGRRVLFLNESNWETLELGEYSCSFNVRSDAHEAMTLSVRNLPRSSFKFAQNISGYDVLVAHDIVLTEAAWAEIENWLS